MESICDELYYGRIRGTEIRPDQTEEYLTASTEAVDALDALRAALSPEQRVLLEQATGKLSAEHALLLKQMYSEGIYFGVRLMAEAYTHGLYKHTDLLIKEKREAERHSG